MLNLPTYAGAMSHFYGSPAPVAPTGPSYSFNFPTYDDLISTYSPPPPSTPASTSTSFDLPTYDDTIPNVYGTSPPSASEEHLAFDPGYHLPEAQPLDDGQWWLPTSPNDIPSSGNTFNEPIPVDAHWTTVEGALPLPTGDYWVPESPNDIPSSGNSFSATGEPISGPFDPYNNLPGSVPNAAASNSATPMPPFPGNNQPGGAFNSLPDGSYWMSEGPGDIQSSGNTYAAGTGPLAMLSTMTNNGGGNSNTLQNQQNQINAGIMPQPPHHPGLVFPPDWAAAPINPGLLPGVTPRPPGVGPQPPNLPPQPTGPGYPGWTPHSPDPLQQPQQPQHGIPPWI